MHAFAGNALLEALGSVLRTCERTSGSLVEGAINAMQQVVDVRYLRSIISPLMDTPEGAWSHSPPIIGAQSANLSVECASHRGEDYGC